MDLTFRGALESNCSIFSWEKVEGIRGVHMGPVAEKEEGKKNEVAVNEVLSHLLICPAT